MLLDLTKSVIFGGQRIVPYTRVCPRIFKQSQTNPKTFHGGGGGSSLEEGGSYKFLGVLENVKQEDRIVPQIAAKCTCKGYLLFVLAG